MFTSSKGKDIDTSVKDRSDYRPEAVGEVVAVTFGLGDTLLYAFLQPCKVSIEHCSTTHNCA